MNVNYSKVFLAVMLGIVLAGTSVRASETDDRIQSSVKDSYVFRTQLKDDSINVNSNNGSVTLTGTEFFCEFDLKRVA
jgi:osmotically-inducible protein OsmY